MTKDELIYQLQDYENKIVGRKITIFTTEDRPTVLKQLAANIPGSKYIVGTSASMSTAGEVHIDGFKIQAKKPKGAGGGSGAGSFVTDLAESAQCFYCAAKWYGSDYSRESLENNAKFVNATGSLSDIYKVLDDDWIRSCIASADKLKAYSSTKRYIFHRGSSLVSQIEANFQSINKQTREFSNINKWTPADIWMVATNFKAPTWNFPDFNQLNNFLLESARNKTLIGVSLKKTGMPAALAEINFDKPKYSTKYVGSNYGKRDYFSAKDVYIMFEGGEIQFRGFPTWQGEIKGKNANHGKISGGPISNILRKHTKFSIDTQAEIDGKVRAKSDSFYKDYFELYKKATGDRSTTYIQFRKALESKENNWITSKYLGTQLIYAVQKSSSDTQQKIVSSIINYAKSMSDFSAPYVKVQ